jgi:hypothetical protein
MEASPPFDLLARLASHPRAALAIGAFCLWISVSLMLHMWFVHRRESRMKKLVWSFLLLLPLFGWLLYAGCFRIPDYSDTPCPPSDAD